MVRAKYSPIGDYLNSETAFLQAADALDMAALIAIKHDDAETLYNVAALWMELGHRVVDEDDDSGDDEGSRPIGFQAEFPEVREVEDDGRNSGEQASKN